MPVNSDKRKHAIRLLNGPPPAAKATGPRRRRRGQTYGSRLVSILKAVWEAADYPWSVRLQALLPEWMPWIRHRFRFKAEIEQQLLQTSPRSIDRRLREEKRKVRRRIYGRTKSGTLLKHHIPVKTDHDERSLSEPDAPVSEPLPALGELNLPIRRLSILRPLLSFASVLGWTQHGPLRFRMTRGFGRPCLRLRCDTQMPC